MSLNARSKLFLVPLIAAALAACMPEPSPPNTPRGPAAGPNAPPYPQPYPQPGPYPQPYPQPGPQPPQPSPVQGRPLLPPLYGTPAMQAETQGILNELIANLAPQYQSQVRGIPLQFDPNPYEVNAFAGCDDNGSAFMAGTGGLMDAVDAIAQTKATDELFGTQTYETYTGQVAPLLVRSDRQSAALPPGIIPPQYQNDPRRLSRAHEIFDEVIAFTFGHELAHHYLGHTGCAVGGGGGLLGSLGALGRIVSRIPTFNQPNEVAADNFGVFDVLDTGRARAPNYRWTEHGGLMLLDFFGRLERAAGGNPMSPVVFLRSHPSSSFRAPIVQGFARTWYSQHPG